MPDGIRFDTSEVDALARTFAKAAVAVGPKLVPVANKAAIGIKKVMRKDASGHSHLPGLPRFVEDDVTVTTTGIEVEVGFKKEGAGNLANIAAYGSTNNAPVMDITRGLNEEAPRFAEWVARMGVEALR